MKRLCFLSPDINHTRKVVADLKSNGIPEKSIYVLAKNIAGMESLPDAGTEADDFLASWERGIAVGGTAGLFAGLVALAFPPVGIVVGGGLVLLIGLFGAGLGSMLGSIVGASLPSSRLAEFEEAIEHGKILVMADVPANDVKKYEDLIKNLDPDVSIEGIEPPASIIP